MHKPLQIKQLTKIVLLYSAVQSFILQSNAVQSFSDFQKNTTVVLYYSKVQSQSPFCFLQCINCQTCASVYNGVKVKNHKTEKTGNELFILMKIF